MKKTKQTNDQPQTKNKAKDKDKSKDAKKEQKENPKDKKVQPEEEEYDYFTPEEIALLDKFHEFSEKKFSDDEIYEVMLKFNNDEELIKNELKEMLKILSKGDEFNWTEIGKSKKIFFYINYLKF
jgi:hypothetical protein